MDYRERKYYLVRFDGVRHNRYIGTIKNNIPLIKIHTPYGHLKINIDKCDYDGHLKNIGYIQLMVSCRKEYCELFEKIMSEIKKQDDYIVCKELTKEMCGQ